MLDINASEALGEAYIQGMGAAMSGEQPDNPYFPGTMLSRAYNSGYRDQIAWQAENGNVTPSS